MLNKFLNQNLFPTVKDSEESKKEITSGDLDTILSLIEQYDQNKLSNLHYQHSSSSLNISIQSGTPQESEHKKISPLEQQPIIITDSVLPLLEDMDLNYNQDKLTNTSVAQSQGNIVKAHMSGSVYLKPAPSEPNFVNENQKVEAKDVLCLLEAMKLFSEVKAPMAGTITKVLVAHGDIVQEGDALFEII